MAASLLVEEESGTTQGHHHPHNGYYAGDFSDQPFYPIPSLARHWPSPRSS